MIFHDSNRNIPYLFRKFAVPYNWCCSCCGIGEQGGHGRRPFDIYSIADLIFIGQRPPRARMERQLDWDWGSASGQTRHCHRPSCVRSVSRLGWQPLLKFLTKITRRWESRQMERMGRPNDAESIRCIDLSVRLMPVLVGGK